MDSKKPLPKGLKGQISAPRNYDPNLKPAPEVKPADMEKLKGKLEDFRKKALKKFPFTRSLSVLPTNATPIFEEDEAIPKEVVDSKPVYLMMIVPEDHYKEIATKIKPEIIKIVNEIKENLWVFIKTEVDLGNYGLDSKYEFIDAIAASFPLHDNGYLGSLRVANIHKSLVLRKFEKYVASYVIGGSFIRGTADATSDVDTFVVIDDTDVKRMSRVELLEKLRGIIYDYIREATALAGVKNILNVQVWLLTDFWQRVKDAEPVAFTFIRDGVPFYDRGTFIPWKRLLQMGRIKPSPEAIDAYMKQGDQTEDFVKRRLIDTMVDIYFGVVTPTQAMMMLVGEAPPVPKTIVSEVKKVLVEKEKLMTLKDIRILEKVVKMYKDYEHGTLKNLTGKDIDQLMKETMNYINNLKDVRKKIEKKVQEKTAEEIYESVFKVLKSVFGAKSQEKLIEDFENQLVKKGKIQPRMLSTLKDLANVKKKLKSGKLSQKEVDKVKGNARELVDSLVEYAQRADLMCTERGTMQILYENRKAELVLMGDVNFLIEGADVKKIEKGRIKKSNKEEFEKAFKEHKGKLSTKVSGEVFEVLKKGLGSFEVIF